MDVRIQAVQFTADQKLRDYINQKVGKLEQHFDRISSVEVYLKLESNSTVKDKIVSIRCNVPGPDLYAEETSKKFEEGIDSAIGSLRRQIKKRKTKMGKR